MADLIEKQQVQNSDMSQRNTDSNVEIELMLENVISQFNDKASVILNDIVDNFYDQKTQSNPEETRLQMMKFVQKAATADLNEGNVNIGEEDEEVKSNKKGASSQRK